MLLKSLSIKNFRGIEDLTVPFDEICVLIGENNAGKSSVLDAIRFCMTRSFSRRSAIFDEYDYHLADDTGEPSKAKPIEITMTFSEAKEDEWPPQVSQMLNEAEQVGKDSLRSITLRIKSAFDASTGDFASDFDFLDLAGNELPKAKSPRLLANLQQLIPTFYLASLRDAAQEFKPRSQFWGPFVRSLDLDDESRAEIERILSGLNEKILSKHVAFESVIERLKKTAELLPLGEKDPVSIEAVPSKVFDILSRTQVFLASKTGAHIPIVRHGNGTQSLAVMCLFDAFLEARLTDRYDKHSVPLLALEEPEAHLHPSAVRATGQMLGALPGQKIISTHSGELLSGVPLNSIRRLRRKEGRITLHRIEPGSLTPDEIRKLDYQVRATRGSLLFSRCWLLVEGETEAVLLPECARLMGRDLYAEGVSCIEYSRVGIEKFIKLADQLGIEWFAIADDDREGQKYIASAKGQLGQRREAEHILALPCKDIEHYLCNEGFGEIYETTVSDQKKGAITAKKGTAEYWQQVLAAQSNNMKPKNAIAAAELMSVKGEKSIPKLLKGVVDSACKLARGAG